MAFSEFQEKELARNETGVLLIPDWDGLFPELDRHLTNSDRS
jgi:hypothetical protein